MTENSDQSPPFRFYDNRQKYLAFVNTCNEKWKVAERAAQELAHIEPTPPAFRLFDAGMGDGTLLANLLRSMHRRYPTIPFFVVGKEISLEDVRLSLETIPDRLVEHPASVIIFTNLFYSESPYLMPSSPEKVEDINWLEVSLDGSSAHQFGEQLRSIDEDLVDGWQVKASKKTGNPLYVKPSILVIYREDQRFLLNDVIPKKGEGCEGNYDLVVISQPWRARMDANFKVKNVLMPLVKCLAPGGRAVTAQSYGYDPGLELIRSIWPEEDPFKTNRHELIRTLQAQLGEHAADFNFDAGSDDNAILRFRMHTLPNEISESIGTSTLFAAWNAAIYVAQIEDDRLEPVVSSGQYFQATADCLHKHNGLWFNDETFVISRRRKA